MMKSGYEIAAPLPREFRSVQTASCGSVGLQLAALEAATIVITSLGAQVVYTTIFWYGPADLDAAVGMGIVVAALFVAIAHARGLYTPERLLKFGKTLPQVAAVWMLTFLIASMAAFLLKVGDHFSRAVTVALLAIGFSSLTLVRYTIGSALNAGFSFGRNRQRRAAIFYHPNVDDQELVSSLERQGYRIIRRIPLPRPDKLNAGTDASSMGEIEKLVRSGELDLAFVTAPMHATEELGRLITDFRRTPLPLHFIPALEARYLIERPIVDYGTMKAIELQRPPLSSFELAVKRALDISVASTAFLCMWPLLAMIAIAIKLDSRGPVIFAQRRVGFTGRVFRIYKFRSMYTLDDGPVVRQATRGDKRITIVGRWLRATSLDELPQLFNVLKGDMSLIGPRPHVIAHDDQYSKLIADYAMRHHMKPGITGLAQVAGCRGETASPHLMARRVGYDLWYIENWSLWLDIKILIRTFVVLGKDPNAY